MFGFEIDDVCFRLCDCDQVIAAKKLPSSGMAIEEGMVLKWSEPDCGNCESRGGDCGFRSNSSAEIECFNLPKSGM